MTELRLKMYMCISNKNMYVCVYKVCTRSFRRIPKTLRVEQDFCFYFIKFRIVKMQTEHYSVIEMNTQRNRSCDTGNG